VVNSAFTERQPTTAKHRSTTTTNQAGPVARAFASRTAAIATPIQSSTRPRPAREADAPSALRGADPYGAPSPARSPKLSSRRSVPAHTATAAANSSPFGLTDPARYIVIGAAAKATPSGIHLARAPLAAARNAQPSRAAHSRALAIRIA
jgi:hypothetical protein